MNCLFSNIFFERTCWTEAELVQGTDDAGEKEEMYVASESDPTCVCDKS